MVILKTTIEYQYVLSRVISQRANLRRTLQTKLVGDAVCQNEVTCAGNAVDAGLLVLLGLYIGPVLQAWLTLCNTT
jgi:hypothetical protein